MNDRHIPGEYAYERSVEDAWEEHCEQQEEMERLHQENETLRVQLAELEAWEDVPNGKHVDGNFRVDRISGHTVVAVSASRDGRSYWAGSTLPDNWRIQRRKEQTDAGI